MKKYLTYVSICFFAIFSFLYMKNVIHLSKSNNRILNNINEYKTKNDYKCREGSINELGIILGISGKEVNVSKSYSNMKGVGFKEELIEYDEDSCVTSAFNNTDRYILGSNPSKNSISIVININTGKYYKEMIKISKVNNIDISILVNNNFIKENEIDLIDYENILIRGNSEEDYNNMFKNINKLNINNVYCVKTNDFDVLKICEENKLLSILMTDEIDINLLYKIKHSLNKGDIVFIKENEFNLNELNASIKYIKSKGIDIVSIDELILQ